MPSFAFVARDESGQTRTGVIDAANSALVASQLRTRGWIVVKLESQESKGSDNQANAGILDRLFAPRSVQVELSLRQLAV
ncbi:MAG: hypothetical protein AAFN70_10245, partial [Planctomycetota bacterium]